MKEEQRRGYFGIGIYHPKTTDNMGTLWRSAYLLGAGFIFTIGHRYKTQPTDTLKATRHVPLFHFDTWKEFQEFTPNTADIVIVEQGGKPLQEFNHPNEAIYVLGAEDTGVPQEYMKENRVIEIPSTRVSSFNVATSGSIVMYDRYIK